MTYPYGDNWVVGSNTPMDDSKGEFQEAYDAPGVIWVPMVPMLVPVQLVPVPYGDQHIFYDCGLNPQAHLGPAAPISADVEDVDETMSQANSAKFETDSEYGMPQGYPQQTPQATLENVQLAEQALAPVESCSASVDQSDSLSDASTDVGDGDDIGDDLEEEVADVSPKHFKVESVEAAQGPSFFTVLSRQQRVDELRRVIDEYCGLEFDSVYVAANEALVYHMISILKSLSEFTSFHAEQGRSEEKRIALLGLGKDDEDNIAEVVSRAQALCERGSFRTAFEALKNVGPRLQARNAMSSDEIEAMKQRRLEKRHRQRQERRMQRAVDRANRASQSSPSASSHSAPNTKSLSQFHDG